MKIVQKFLPNKVEFKLKLNRTGYPWGIVGHIDWEEMSAGVLEMFNILVWVV